MHYIGGYPLNKTCVTSWSGENPICSCLFSPNELSNDFIKGCHCLKALHAKTKVKQNVFFGIRYNG